MPFVNVLWHLLVHVEVPEDVFERHALRVLVRELRGEGLVAEGGQVAAHRPLFLRSEEHTSELQSQSNLVCRLLLEKKKNDDATEVAHNPSRVIAVSQTHRGHMIPCDSSATS